MRKTSVWALVTVTVFASILGAACGDDSESGGVCADVDCGSAPKYGALAWSNCTSCHSNDAATRTKNAVPDNSDYTTYAGVTTPKSRIMEIAERVNGEGAIMPPAAKLSDADKKAFTAWGCCEGPQ